LSLPPAVWDTFVASRKLVPAGKKAKSRFQLIFEHCRPVGGAAIGRPSTDPYLDPTVTHVYTLPVGGKAWYTKSRVFNLDFLRIAYNCSAYNDALFVDHRGNPIREGRTVSGSIAVWIERATGLKNVGEKLLKKFVHTYANTLTDEQFKLCGVVHEHIDRVARRNYTFTDFNESINEWSKVPCAWNSTACTGTHLCVHKHTRCCVAL
jgi:hypothetical protein